MPSATNARRAGFSLVEILTVVAIVAILLTILIPTIGKVRRSAQTASVKQQLIEISGAIERFQQDQNQYPGPLPDLVINATGKGVTVPPMYTIYDAAGSAVLPNAGKITQAENLVLGLLGGLKWRTGTPNRLCYDPAMVGRGMVALSGSTKKFEPYLSLDPKTISKGKYEDGAGVADDSEIPEFLDRYPNPMPILYLRARKGASGVVSFAGQDLNGYINTDRSPTQYDLYDMIGYVRGTSRSIGEGKSIRAKDYTTNFNPQPTQGVFPHGLQNVLDSATMDKSDQANYEYPYNALPYFLDSRVAPTDTSRRNATGTARSKNTYILISAGLDRVYGTADDVCSFGDFVN